MSNNDLLQNQSIQGIITLNFRDADTMKIKRTVVTKNAICIGGVYSTIMKADFDFFNNGHAKFSARTIVIGDRICSNNMRTMGTAFYNKTGESAVFESNEQSPWTFFEGSPDYTEKVGRFLQPGSDRTINVIGLLDTFDGKQGFATASLGTPCIQTTSEILDVTYRIQFFYQTPDPALLPVGANYGQDIAKKLANDITDSQKFPGRGTLMFQAVPADGSTFNGQLVDTSQAISSSLIIKDHLKSEFTLNKSISSNIGVIMRSIGYGGSSNSMYIDNTLAPMSTAWAPLAPPSFVNKPIQTIHNHRVDAIEWGLDVDFLAEGQGSLTVDGSSWTDDEWPEFWRIDHTVTGQVGVSRYALQTRRTTGFNGNTYQITDPGNDRSYGMLWAWHENQVGTEKTIKNGHGLRTLYKLEEYDEQTFISWDDTGLTILNINKTDVRNFDALSTPALSVTGINQVAVDSDGNVWVACRFTGLYRITDPYGSPVITLMTEASNTLPGGSDGLAYGVALGYNGDVLAIVEGALVRTTNPNAATPLFASESFTYTGITDNNWNTVTYMRSDRNHPEYQSAIVHNSNAPTFTLFRHVWWSTTETGTAGPESNSYTIQATGNFNQTHFGRLQISRRGSLWTWKGPAQNLGPLRRQDFGDSADGVILGDTGLHPYGGGGFFYDYYDTPHVMAMHGNSDWIAMWSAADKHFGSSENQQVTTQGSYTACSMIFQTGKGIGCYFNQDHGATNAGEGGDIPSRVNFKAPRTDEYLDPLNGRYSPHEDMIWTKYNWNGASWEEDYYVDATDTGDSGSYPGSRENFDVEDHTFTGRSMIDITDVFAAGNFSSTAVATFVFKLIPEAKLSTANNDTASAQEKPRTLLDISDATQQFQILWDSDIQGNITIVEDGDGGTVIASTPANGETYRLVVVVNGTSVDVYLNGSVIGSTVTLGLAYDWSNGSSDLIAFLGCEVYQWEYPQRNSPWQSNFYRGVMENVQIWDLAWDAANVTSDNGNIDGTLAGGDLAAANEVARFELTQSLSTLETKLSHAGAEALVEGVTIAFANGGAPDAFIAGEYHTFGVVDGIFKDNAIAFTQNYSIYFTQVDHDFTVFDNGVGGDTIAASSTVVTDEKAIFMNLSPLDTNQSVTSSLNGDNYQCDTIPGQLGQNKPVGSGHNGPEGAHTVQVISGNGYFQAKPMFGDSALIIGLTDDPSNNNDQQRIQFGIELKTNGSVDINEAGVIVSADLATYVVTDTFRVTRVGTAITYYKNAGLIYTSGNTSSSDLYGRISISGEGHGAMDAIITHTRPPYILTVGDPAIPDGVFDPDYFRVETRTVESIAIFIDGSPATINISETYHSNMIAPGPGEVSINGKSGWLVFNSGDVGATITGNVTVLYDRY